MVFIVSGFWFGVYRVICGLCCLDGVVGVIWYWFVLLCVFCCVVRLFWCGGYLSWCRFRLVMVRLIV